MRRAAPLLLTLLFACSSPKGVSQSSAPADGPALEPAEATSAAKEERRAQAGDEDRGAGSAPESKSPAPPPPPPQPGPVGQGEPAPLVDAPKATEKQTSKNKRDDGKGAAPMAATTKSLSGRLSSADVEGVVTGAIDRFSRCTTVDLTVEIKAVIGGDGRVIEVKIPRSQPDDPRARDCVGASFKELSFPKSSDNKSSPIAFELNLRRRAE
jgi:hypothetical protein